MDGLEHRLVEPFQVARELEGEVEPHQACPSGAAERDGHSDQGDILRQVLGPGRHQGVEVATMRAAVGEELDHLDPVGTLCGLRRRDRPPVTAFQQFGRRQCRQRAAGESGQKGLIEASTAQRHAGSPGYFG